MASIGVWVLIVVIESGSALSPESQDIYLDEAECVAVATHILEVFPEALVGCEKASLFPALGLSI